MSEREKKRSFVNFLRWYNNKDLLSNMEDLQKTVNFYHNQSIDKLKLGCISFNTATICMQNCASAKIYPFTICDKEMISKFFAEMVGRRPVLFTQKTVVDETHIQNFTNVCKSIARMDASKLYPRPKCQPMPTILYTWYEFDADLLGFKPRRNKTRSLEKMLLLYVQ